MYHFVGAALNIFFLPLLFRNLIGMCIGVVLFAFILLDVHSSFWICKLVFFIKFEVSFRLDSFFCPSYPLFFLEFQLCVCEIFWYNPTDLWGSIYLKCFFCLVFRLFGFYWSVFKFTDSSAISNILLNLFLNFLFHYFAFQFKNFYLVLFYNFLFSTVISYLFAHSDHIFL